MSRCSWVILAIIWIYSLMPTDLRAQDCSPSGDGTSNVSMFVGVYIEGPTSQTCTATVLIPKGRKFFYFEVNQHRLQVPAATCGGLVCSGTAQATIGSFTHQDSYDGLSTPLPDTPVWRVDSTGSDGIHYVRRLERILNVEQFTQQSDYFVNITLTQTGGLWRRLECRSSSLVMCGSSWPKRHARSLLATSLIHIIHAQAPILTVILNTLPSSPIPSSNCGCATSWTNPEGRADIFEVRHRTSGGPPVNRPPTRT